MTPYIQSVCDEFRELYQKMQSAENDELISIVVNGKSWISEDFKKKFDGTEPQRNIYKEELLEDFLKSSLESLLRKAMETLSRDIGVIGAMYEVPGSGALENQQAFKEIMQCVASLQALRAKEV